MNINDITNTNAELIIHISSVIVQGSALSYARNRRFLVVNFTDFIFFLTSRSKSGTAITDATAQEAIDTGSATGGDSDNISTG